MFKTSRETTINQGIRDTATIHLLEDYLIRIPDLASSQLISISADRIPDLEILGLGDGKSITPKPFAHPVTVEHHGKTYLIADMRTCSKFNVNDQMVKITNPSLFRREVIRVALEGIWMTGGVTDILNTGIFQLSIYSKWIAELISRRFGLDAEQQMQISVYAAFFYLCMFNDPERMDPSRTILMITRATKLSTSFIMEVLNGIDYIPNIEALLDLIKVRLETRALDGLVIDIFIAMLSGSWFGANNAVLVGTALEYPPTWCALLYLSLTESVNRTTGIGKLALRFDRDPTCREFLAATNALIIRETTIDVIKARG